MLLLRGADCRAANAYGAEIQGDTGKYREIQGDISGDLLLERLEPRRLEGHVVDTSLYLPTSPHISLYLASSSASTRRISSYLPVSPYISPRARRRLAGSPPSPQLRRRAAARRACDHETGGLAGCIPLRRAAGRGAPAVEEIGDECAELAHLRRLLRLSPRLVRPAHAE